MGAVNGAWIVAASIGTVEALKDHGICRWNYTIRSFQEHAKSNINRFSHTNSPSNSSSNSSSAAKKKVEEFAEKIVHISCLGPNTIRF